MTQPLSRRSTLGLMAGAATMAMPHVVRAQTLDIVAHYSMPPIFKEAQETLAEAFNKKSGKVKVTYVNPTPTYEDGAQLILRQATTGGLPDVSFQGLNRLRLFSERGIAANLKPFLEREGDVGKLGYSAPLLGLGFHGGVQCGLAFATSNPISYLNADLLKRVGADAAAFPTSWDEVIALSAKVHALGDGNEGMFFRWPGDDWMFSSLLYGYGGRMLNAEETKVAFDGPEGLAALKLLDRMVKEGKMPNFGASATATADLQAFGAGKLGTMFRTTAQVRQVSGMVGKNFELKTTTLPVIDPVKGRLPTGGAGMMMTAKDPARQAAAWEFMKFASSAEGTAIMARNTGYVPCNQLAIDDAGYLGEFYRANPLFQAATKQVHLMIPWYAFPGQNSVRVTQIMVDNLARIAEQKASPEEVLRDMSREVGRLIPRA
ncbi:MAG: ABC transporter substrate-binding protein [Phreatobacter sp.]